MQTSLSTPFVVGGMQSALPIVRSSVIGCTLGFQKEDALALVSDFTSPDHQALFRRIPVQECNCMLADDSPFSGPHGANRQQYRRLSSSEAAYAHRFPSLRPKRITFPERTSRKRFLHHCVPPNFRDTPPRRDTGIASEQDWGITLKSEPFNESGLNSDGSTWYRESGEDIGENGYRCRWTIMGGRSADGSNEWKETWWEKSDWTGYKELGAEKSGRNAKGGSWWETWQEVFRQDEWSGLARIEKSAHKQAKSQTDGIWNEKWWEKYNAKGWTEKGAHKNGRMNDHSWWEKWGEQYDGRGAVLKWTDKWAESDNGSRWGDKWEERFNSGVGSRQGETWHVSPSGVRWSRTWGEEHSGNGKVHKYGKSTSGEQWDVVVNEPTYYEAEPHYGWAEAVANSLQLLGIEIREKSSGQGNNSIPPPPSPPTPPPQPPPSSPTTEI